MKESSFNIGTVMTILLVVFCTGLGVFMQYSILEVLVDSSTIAIAFGIVLGIAPGFLMSIVFTRSPLAAEAIKKILNSTGGAVLIILMLAFSSLYVIQIQFLLAENFTIVEAFFLVVGPHLPTMLSVSIFSNQFLYQIFDEDRIRTWWEGLELLEHLNYEIYRMTLLQLTVEEVRELTKNDPTSQEYFNALHLKAQMGTQSLMRTSKALKQYNRYEDDPFLDRAEEALQNIPYAKQQQQPEIKDEREARETLQFERESVNWGSLWEERH